MTSKYENIRHWNPAKFRCSTGVRKQTFTAMLKVITQAEAKKKQRGGRPNRQSLEDQLLMSLEYLREYRTYFHLSQSYGVSESTAYRTCRFVEDTLFKSSTFRLLGRKALLISEDADEVILVDATESPVERPKKREFGRSNR